MERFGWCVIGTGGIARRVFEDTKDMRILSLYSRSHVRAQEYADMTGGTVCGTPEEAIRFPGVEGVYVATPHTAHMTYVLQALRLGKPVLCEKPMGIAPAQVEEMIEEARKRDVFLAEAMWPRFNPVLQTVRDWIAKGYIGQVRYMTADFSDSRPVDYDQHYYKSEAAGGGLLDMGIYPIALAGMVYGTQPQKIHAFGKTDHGVDTRLTAVLEYEDHRTAVLYSGLDVVTGWDAMIYGESGRIQIPAYWMAKEATLIKQNGEMIRTHREGCTGWGNQIREVESLIRSGKKEAPQIPLEDTLSTSRIMADLLGQLGIAY